MDKRVFEKKLELKLSATFPTTILNIRYFLTSQETSVSEELNLPALATCCGAGKYKIDCRVKPDNDKQASLCSKLEVKVCGASLAVHFKPSTIFSNFIVYNFLYPIIFSS